MLAMWLRLVWVDRRVAKPGSRAILSELGDNFRQACAAFGSDSSLVQVVFAFFWVAFGRFGVGFGALPQTTKPSKKQSPKLTTALLGRKL